MSLFADLHTCMTARTEALPWEVADHPSDEQEHRMAIVGFGKLTTPFHKHYRQVKFLSEINLHGIIRKSGNAITRSNSWGISFREPREKTASPSHPENS